jgi:cutinase
MDMQSWRSRWVAALGALFFAFATQAQTNPFANGPDPTSDLLNAAAGPYAVLTIAKSASQVSGFGGGTIYYPETLDTYAVVVLCPGFTGTQSSVAWLARRLASHGFVTMAINTNSGFDFPPSRATQMMAALRYVTTASDAVVRARVDVNRQGVGGHSMGGGGSLIAARDNPTLKMALPLTPWNSSTDFSTVQVPALIIGAELDSVAPVSSHAVPFYNSLPATLDKAYAELNDAGHSAPTSTNTPVGRYSVSWAKRFMDLDTRYDPFLCGEPHTTYATPSVFSRYWSTCPY